MATPNIYSARNTLKTATLQAIHNGVVTSNEIQKNIGYPDAKSLKSNICNLEKRGYISAKKEYRGNKPYKNIRVYALTKRGIAHALHPAEFVAKREANFTRKIELWIEQNSEDYQGLIENMVGRSSGNSGGSSGYKDDSDFGGTTAAGEIKSDGESETELEKANKRIKILSEIIAGYQKKEHFEHQEKNEKEIIESEEAAIKRQKRIEFTKHRRETVSYYMKTYGGMLDSIFFEEIGGTMFPCLLAGTVFLNRGSVEIISKGNKEFERKHVRSILTNDQILKAKLRIINVKHNGFVVNGKGMDKPQVITFDMYNQTNTRKVKDTPKIKIVRINV